MMTPEEIVAWALAHGWRETDAHLKFKAVRWQHPSGNELQIVLCPRVARLEAWDRRCLVWTRLGSCPYKRLELDELGMPRGLGLISVLDLDGRMAEARKQVENYFNQLRT